jgi:hypothetical protein
MAIPLASMVGLTWLAAGQPELGGLVTYGFSRLALQTISIGEILLAAFFVGSIVATSVKEAGLLIQHIETSAIPRGHPKKITQKEDIQPHYKQE